MHICVHKYNNLRWPDCSHRILAVKFVMYEYKRIFKQSQYYVFLVILRNLLVKVQKK
jgi:hypothetical protein